MKKTSSNKYTEAKDKAADSKLMKNMSPKQKATFKKLDSKHAKAKTMAQDKRMDSKIIKSMKSSKRGK